MFIARREDFYSTHKREERMAASARSAKFFLGASAPEFDAVLALYDQALRLKAESKSSKPDNVVKLDKW